MSAKTLHMLTKYGVTEDEITVFVANGKELEDYRKTIGAKYKIVVGIPGMKNIRNFMKEYFKPDQEILYIDDDVAELWECQSVAPGKNGNRLVQLKHFRQFVENAFCELSNRKLKLWGIYPVNNAFFMKYTGEKGYISSDLKYIIGAFYGVKNDRITETRKIDDKEDFERTIAHYLNDGGVVRFNNITMTTNYYKEPGGMQVERTEDRVTKSAIYLATKYPGLCSLNSTKKSGHLELRLRDKRGINEHRK